MNWMNLLKRIMKNRGTGAAAIILAVVLVVSITCVFYGTTVPASPFDKIADGYSSMSAVQKIEGNADSALSGEFPDGNNGFHLNLKESDVIPGENDRETAKKTDEKGISRGVSSNTSVNDDNATESNEYFYTTIDESVVLTDVSYSFSIIHLQPQLSVESTLVKVNDSLIENFQGQCRLFQGENTIEVEVTYQKSDKSYVSQKRRYQLLVELKDIAISTDLKDGTIVDQPTILFTAYAKRKDAAVSLDAALNGKKLDGSYISEIKQEFSVSLQEGKNEIVLTAKDSYGTKKLSLSIEYRPAQTKINIKTDLVDSTVSTANIKFTAKAYTEKKEEVPVSVSVNGTLLTGEGDSYRAELEEGKNTIVLSAGSGKEQITQTYHIKYVPEIVEPGGDDPSHTAPKLVTDLVDGSIITGNTLTFYIQPVSYKGERIRGQNVAVTCNGEKVDYVWDDSTATSYRAALKSGENEITITPTDTEGHALTFPYKVTCNEVGSGESLGHVTLSIEATTIGLGNIVDATQVEIFDGVNAAKMLTDLLAEYGYDYSASGSVDSGFYLSRISGSGMIHDPKVPSDLEEHLTAEEDSEYDLGKYNSDSLGEFDFAKGSGWMYSVNGHYPNYGFSDCYPHDGDVIRVRFTLYYGKDIGGGYSMGDGDEENWGDW